jgi:hypothetical protein
MNRRLHYEVTATDRPGIFHVVSGVNVNGERVVESEFDTVLGLLLQTEYHLDGQRPMFGRNYRRRNDFEIDVVAAVQRLELGERIEFTAVERSQFGLSSDRFEVPTSVELVRCETLSVGGREWPVNVYHVVSGGRSQSPDGDSSLVMQEKTVYVSQELAWPVRTETSMGAVDVVDIQSR